MMADGRAATALAPASSAAVLVLAYLGQIVVYRPQNSTGWPFAWFLYSGVVDLVLGYYGWQEYLAKPATTGERE